MTTGKKPPILILVAENRHSTIAQIIYFVGFFLLLIGAYGMGRTVVNIVIFDKYPLEGAIPNNLLVSNNNYFSQREADCAPYQSYFDANNLPRVATAEEKVMEKDNEQRCLTGINEDRARTKRNDINTSLFFLFLGLGALASRHKYLLHHSG